MLLQRVLSLLSVAFIAGTAGACQLVLPDGTGGSGSTGTGKTTATGSTGTSSSGCAASCDTTKIEKCDNTFKTRCLELCAVVGTTAIDCAVNAPNTACTATLSSQTCKTDFCAAYDTVCAGSGSPQCNTGNCSGLWLLLAQKYKNTCAKGWRDACSQLDKTCAEAAAFSPQQC